MMSSNKWLPLVLILVGGSLLIGLLIFSIFGFPQPKSLANPPLPQNLAGFPLSRQLSGSEALAEFNQLHGKSLAVTSGVKGFYGEWGGVTLWVAGADSSDDIRQLTVAMEQSISQGKSPFTPEDSIERSSTTVYPLTGMGQRHFYFQTGKFLIWLAADPNIADQALQETLDFYH